MIKAKSPEKASLELLLQKNQKFADHYKTSPIMHLIKSNDMKEKKKRERLLDCIQTFSDYFQKTVILRNALCDNRKFLAVTQLHLQEEFCHNLKLLADRSYNPPTWNPILDATASWFTWKMFTLDNEEKIVLMHLVLETSANIFFKEAHKVMHAYGETDYFKIHAEVDSEHEKMGAELLKNLSTDKYERLLEVQYQGWEMLNAVCDQIAALTNSEHGSCVL